jgi:GTP-binding protein
MFIDKVNIHIRAGDGGAGAVSFHREEYVSHGGPDGGDGGRGGHVILRADDHLATLMDFRYKRVYQAENGKDGGARNCSGKSGADLILRLPRGTLILEKESGAVIADLSLTEEIILAKGGRGGWGNQHFATPTRQAPRFAKRGLPGEEFALRLELKLLADVGLVGFPNVGKSTLLSVVSAARPKIADYHFTTLAPNLGVISVDADTAFVMADIPGLIEGAAQGIGLGIEFLRHVERCRLLVHVLDGSGSEGRDPAEDYHAINNELRQYHPELAARPQILAVNKCDVGEEHRERLEELARDDGIPVHFISAATRQGVGALMKDCAEALSSLPPIKVYYPDYVPPEPSGETGEITAVKQDGVWLVECPWIARLMGDVNFSDYESRQYFDRVLRRRGVFERLEELGVRDGDTVSLYELTFDYVT